MHALSIHATPEETAMQNQIMKRRQLALYLSLPAGRGLFAALVFIGSPTERLVCAQREAL